MTMYCQRYKAPNGQEYTERFDSMLGRVLNKLRVEGFGATVIKEWEE